MYWRIAFLRWRNSASNGWPFFVSIAVTEEEAEALIPPSEDDHGWIWFILRKIVVFPLYIVVGGVLQPDLSASPAGRSVLPDCQDINSRFPAVCAAAPCFPRPITSSLLSRHPAHGAHTDQCRGYRWRCAVQHTLWPTVTSSPMINGLPCGLMKTCGHVKNAAILNVRTSPHRNVIHMPRITSQAARSRHRPPDGHRHEYAAGNDHHADRYQKDS